jgi:hypothetical protein
MGIHEIFRIRIINYTIRKQLIDFVENSSFEISLVENNNMINELFLKAVYKIY